jgi:hypothetical protein
VNHYFARIPGWFFWPEACDRIVAALPQDRPATVVVLGVWAGRSTAYLGVELVNAGKPVTLVCVDHFRGEAGTVEQRDPMLAGLEARFRVNLAPVGREMGERFLLRVENSDTAARHYADRSVDAVWVDAGTSRHAVERDIAAWWPKVRDGGLMGGCTYGQFRVQRAVARRFRGVVFHEGTTEPDCAWWLVTK